MCLVVEWPAREAAVLMLAPFAMIFVIKEWRAQWKVIGTARKSVEVKIKRKSFEMSNVSVFC